MAIDLYHDEARWNNWKKEYEDKDIEDVSAKNSDIIKRFLKDAENGNNVGGSKKGGRSFVRLNTLRVRLVYLAKLFEQNYNGIRLTRISSSQVNATFNSMRRGDIKKQDGEAYKSVSDYVKVFKTFWHWWQKVNRLKKTPKYITDTTTDLDTSNGTKPVWVFLEPKQMDKLINESNAYYKPLLSFAYDTGARVSEIFSLRVEDISQDAQGGVYANIKDEYSKGGKCGRKVKLMLCGNELLKYIKDNKLKPTDMLFSHSVYMTNDYLGILAKKLFGDGKSEGGEFYSKMTLYDFRHNSCCFWLDRYKRSSDLMYRFGWTTEKYIHYYSEFRGKTDKITDEDMFVDITKLDVEKKLEVLEKKFNLLLKRVEKQNA